MGIYQNYNYYRNYNTIKPQQISFEGKTINKDTLIRVFHLNPLRHFEEFTTDEYRKLSDREIQRLRNKYKRMTKKDKNNIYQSMERIHQKTAIYIKNTFDKEFGEGNYTVIIIGRSLSSIGKVLSYKIGKNRVKSLPMSQASRYNCNIEDFYVKNDFDYLIEYLNSIGLSKEEISKSDKHKYILIDYCDTGNSLKGAYHLLQSKYIYNNNKNLIARDIIDSCIKNESDASSLRLDLAWCHFKVFSFVKHCSMLRETQNSLVNPQKEENSIKLMWFKLLDNHIRGLYENS